MEKEISVKQWIVIFFVSIVILWIIWGISFAIGNLALALLFSIFFAALIYLLLIIIYKGRRK
jgi:hypothetical protein